MQFLLFSPANEIKRMREKERTRETEAVAQRCSVKKMFLQILQNWQKNTCARVYFKKKAQAIVFSCEFCEIPKNTFLHNTSGQLLSEK